MTTRLLLPFIALLFIVSCSTESADTIYTNGPIIAMTGAEDIHEAIAIKDGKILAIGAESDINQYKGGATQTIDLQGKTLLPGFIDAHSHIMMGMQLIDYVNLSSPPVSEVNNIKDIINKLKKKQVDDKIAEGEWIIGWGYDPDLLDEGRHPNKFDLDEAFPNNPVYLNHVSGHLATMNSRALEQIGYTSETPSPAGGEIYRVGSSREPTGLVSETAMAQARAALPKLDNADVQNNLNKAFELYISNGITTANDGFTSALQINQLLDAQKEIDFPIDIIGLLGFTDLPVYMKEPFFEFKKYNNRVKIAGVKIVSDGSPQGKTAKMAKPYLTPTPGCAHDCTGISLVNQEQLDQLLNSLYSNGIQAFTHCNGDGAIDMYLNAHAKALSTIEKESKDLRSVIIHSQFMRPDLINEYANYGLIPSYFTNHTFFWGDVHLNNMGKERADFTSPIRSSIDAGITYTNHNDYPITPLSQPMMLSTAVNRTSRSATVIGPDQRVSAYEALKAITINAAFQYFEEDIKGSLEPGKLADLVILSDNPLEVASDQLDQIEVIETIKEGKSIWKKKAYQT